MTANIRKTVFNVLIVYAAFLAQSLIFENVSIFGASPNILIAVLILISVGSSPYMAVICGAFGGLLEDALCARLFGMHILAYMYLAAATALTADEKSGNSPLLFAWVCFVYTALFGVASALAAAMIGVGADIGKIAASVFVRGGFSAVTGFLTVLASQRRKRKKMQPRGSESI